jgi:hypothetical protein
VVVASCPVEAVRFTGGWVFDRVMAGWEAIACLADGSDPRPLRILGAHTVDLAAALPSAGGGPQPHILAVEAGLFVLDPRVRQAVRNVLHEGVVEVQFWGDSWPADLDGYPSMQHRLSVAARAFKAHALAAAAAPADPVAVTETFRSAEPPRVRPPSDLVLAR